MVGVEEKLKIQIVEHNNQVLSILIRDIGLNLKDGEDIALVRFDSYADFLVPKDVQADEIEKLDQIVDSINNQSWILPAVYRGLISKIFWFKPPWAHQFQDGQYQFQVGKCQQTGLLKIASTIPYFTSNCVYSSNENLSNIHTVDIFVSTAGLAKNYSPDKISDNENLDEENRKKIKTESMINKRIYPLDAELLEHFLEKRSFLLDVNLAFFSTDDSIRKQFDENEYEILRYVYTRIVQENSDIEIQRYIAARETTLEQIRKLMEEFLNEPKSDQNIVTENPYLSALIGVIRYKKLNWKEIHHYGMHLSDTRPPLHVSSEEMIVYLLESMSKILLSIKKKPKFITISRCVEDGFCSLEQGNFIQKYLEKKLRKIYSIEETIGKSLFVDDDDDEREEQEAEPEEEAEEGKKNKELSKNLEEVPTDLSNSSATRENSSTAMKISTISPSSLSEPSPSFD